MCAMFFRTANDCYKDMLFNENIYLLFCPMSFTFFEHCLAEFSCVSLYLTVVFQTVHLLMLFMLFHI